MWSLGVIAYQLFSQGELPFDGDGEIQVFKAIRKGKFYLPEEQRTSAKKDGPYDWQTMSPEAKDFISQLLTRNPQKRPSALQAL